MSFIETHEIKNSTIMLMFSERDEIQTNPDYQRMGGVWNLEKRRLLIDSIINDYDLPKIYFHEFSREAFSETGYRYAIIDGRQRLETIWQFMDDGFSLSDHVFVQRDSSINLSGLRYSDISREYPRLKIKFDSFVLPIIAVRTENDEIDLIEDMFSRLNEAVPLNAAEKRNAIGGDMVDAIRRVASHDLFAECVRFSNSRFQHREIAARMLLTEHNLLLTGKIIDTKKVYLDQLAREFKAGKSEKVEEILDSVWGVLDYMTGVFHQNDELLLAQGTMIVYYLLFRKGLKSGGGEHLSRRGLINFREDVRRNRLLAEEDYTESKFELLEFDRLNQQGTNDASSIMTRYKILGEYLGLLEPDVD